MMRSFGARPDTAVIDEPFYAAYLAATGLDHPMRNEVLASQPCDCPQVISQVLGPVPQGKPIWYQKHMAHHMIASFSREWLTNVRNAFLIRDPAAVLASYVRKREAVELADIGIVQQRELFEREAQRLGTAPPVVESDDVLANPPGVLAKLCDVLGIAFTEAMLRWPAGRRDTDGAWAPAWYGAVEQSTCFAPPAGPAPASAQPATVNEAESRLPDHLRRIADEARPHYEVLKAHRIR